MANRRRGGEPRTVVVTGASAGVGRAVARAFGARGANVALLARGTDGLEGAERDVAEAGGIPLAIEVDVADPAAVDAAAGQVVARFGGLDVWVNNAFSSVFAPFWQIAPDEFARTTEVTYLGYVWGTRAALDRMLPRDRGAIVQVGSALAYRGIPLQSAYCGSKHAIQGFTESLRCELLHQRSHVRVTMVQLPAVNTPQFGWVRSRLRRRAQPVPPIYQPELAAKAILYAAEHPRRREYWVGGSTAGTLIANAIAPGLLDRYLARTGFAGQQTRQPHDPSDPGNLFRPADSETDVGAHGDVDRRGHRHSLQLWASEHHGVLAAAAAATVAAAAAAGSNGSSSRFRVRR
jgi:NAD(P)-dependent dehydrogenase (short-subunit alcohol dehydrogenase family)